MDGLQCHWLVLSLKEFKDVEGFGQNRNKIEAARFA
jgi:hypothetical protein